MSWLSCILSNIVLAALLASLAWFVQRGLKRPAVARVLWVLVLAKLAAPPLMNVSLGHSPAAIACALGVCACGAHGGTLGLVQGALPWVLLSIWFAGALTTGAMAWRHWAAFRQLLVHASPAPADWQSLAAGLAETLSIRRPPEVLAVPGRLPPLVLPGWRRPRMLLPEDLIGQLNSSQREALLTHELVHIRRGDHLVRILELVIGVAYWWLPVVRSAGKQLRACEETCCDAAVVSHLPDARRDYACLLLDVVDFASPPPGRALPQATAMSAASDLEDRLRAILHGTPGTRRTWPAGMLALTAACAILPCELRYESRPRLIASQATQEPASSWTLPVNAERPLDFSAVGCCPR